MENKENVSIENENQVLDFVSEDLKKTIEKKIAELKESTKVKRILPIAV